MIMNKKTRKFRLEDGSLCMNAPATGLEQLQHTSRAIPQNEGQDRGDQRDLLAEALDKWESFKAKNQNLSEIKGN